MSDNSKFSIMLIGICIGVCLLVGALMGDILLLPKIILAWISIGLIPIALIIGSIYLSIKFLWLTYPGLAIIFIAIFIVSFILKIISRD